MNRRLLPKVANTFDKDLLLKGTCGGSELELVLNDIESLLGEPSQQHAHVKDSVDEIRAKFDSDTARWPDLYEAQRLRLEVLPFARLEIDIASLRSTFTLVSGPVLAAKYQETILGIAARRDAFEKATSATPEAIQTFREETLRAEAFFLLGEIQFVETYRPHQERKRLSIAFNNLATTIFIVLFFHILGLAYAIAGAGQYPSNPLSLAGWWGWLRTLHETYSIHYPRALVLICTFGSVGACMSTIVRLQDSFREGRMILNSTRYMRKFKDYVVAPLSGAIFALLMAFIFCSGLGKQILPPIFANLAPQAGSKWNFDKFLRDGCWPEREKSAADSNANPENDSPTSAPASTPAANNNNETKNAGSEKAGALNLAVLLVWAFAAGFAERLIPDTLDRLVGGRTPSKTDSAEKSKT